MKSSAILIIFDYFLPEHQIAYLTFKI